MQKWSSKGRQVWKRCLSHLRNQSKVLRVRHINLFFAMAFSLAGAVVIAIVAALVLAPRLNVGTQTTPPADLTRLSLTIAAGVGGVVALVVAYRRQRDLEQGRFVEGFGAAAKQLGDSDVAVRLAGVYAMAGVADQTSKLKRQQCIDVLCGYLRLPYSPELGHNHQSALILKRPTRRKGGSEEELRFDYRQNDKEVRQTIVRVIAAHLREKAANSWASNDFDFTGSHLEQPNFGWATFNGGVWWDGATFSGDTSFEGATFSTVASFNGVTFGGDALFSGATFRGDYTSFHKATFSENTMFDGATFSGDALFRRTTFSGRYTVFDGATFSGDYTSFDAATFSCDRSTSFYCATFSSGITLFHNATFSGGATAFDAATFSGRTTSFNKATFSSGTTSFNKADFGAGKVSFEGPVVWNPAPSFDWDPGIEVPTLKPTNVEPQNWPPLEQRV